jgi:hypothetical protein
VVFLSKYHEPIQGGKLEVATEYLGYIIPRELEEVYMAFFRARAFERLPSVKCGSFFALDVSILSISVTLASLPKLSNASLM